MPDEPPTAFDSAGDPSMPWRPNGHTAGIGPLEFTLASSYAGRQPPERPWLVDDWIPRRQVTLLTGDGGTGKSLLAMQLQIAAASAAAWLGLQTMPCRSAGLYAEDEDEELHRRLFAVAHSSQIDVATLDRAAWRSAIADPCELVEVGENGNVTPTEYYFRLESYVTSITARLLVLDAATNLYGGDEIRRRQVNGFIGLLRRLAIKMDGAVLLLAHPSAQGISTGSGLSGSTHWNNAVRSRLYFTKATGDDADPDERVLSRLKSNYSASGDSITVRWSRGAFVALGEPGRLDRAAASAKADRVFLALLSKSYSLSSWVCPNGTARNYAPTAFARHPDREGLARPAFELAMHRLLNGGLIKVERYGRPSEPRSRLARA